MKITRVETILLTVALDRDYGGSVYSVPRKNAIITRIHTDDGLVGHCVNGEGGIDVHRQARQIVDQELAPLLVGQDPTAIETLWSRMWTCTHRGGRDKWAAVRAVACADSALWDLLGKRAGLPLYQLWGGARDALPIVAIGGQYRDGYAPEDYGAEMLEYRAIGLAGCKFKVGGRSVEEDLARTRAARKAGGDDFLLFVDANRGWTRQQAYAFCRQAQDLNLRWFEEPCHWDDDRRDLALLRSQTGLPIAAGQSEITVQDCRDLMLDAAIDVCNLDASWGGGPTAWLRVAHMAACFGVQMGHHGEPVVGSHLLAAVGNGTYVETHHPNRDPIFHQMLIGRGRIEGGYYHLPQGPGWGVDFDPEFIERYRVD